MDRLRFACGMLDVWISILLLDSKMNIYSVRGNFGDTASDRRFFFRNVKNENGSENVIKEVIKYDSLLRETAIKSSNIHLRDFVSGNNQNLQEATSPKIASETPEPIFQNRSFQSRN